jgi:hypothetical protein
MAEFSKTTFSVVDLTKIIGVIICFVVQNYSLKNEIHDAVTKQDCDKQVSAIQFSSLEKSVNKLEHNYSLLMESRSPADKPKPIKIETE